MIIELISFLAFIVLVAIVLWLEQRHSASVDQRLRAPEAKVSLEQESIFDKIDAKLKANSQKQHQRKYARPVTKDIFLRGGLYAIAGLALLYIDGKLNYEHTTMIALSCFAAIAISYLLQKYIIMPKYISTFEEILPGNVKLFAQELDFQTNIADALKNTKNYAHPEMVRHCTDIARLNSLGLSIEQAINKILPDVRSDKFMMLLATLLIHEQTGGRLASVLRNLSELFQLQVLVSAKVSKKTNSTKIFAFMGIFILPLFALFLYYQKNEVFMSFMHDPAGIIMAKMIAGLILINLVLSIYFLRSMRL